MKKFIAMVGMSLMLALGNTALAHPDEDFPQEIKTRVLMLEAKRSAQGVTVLVTEDGIAYPTAGASGTLTLVNGSTKQVLRLKPSGDNTMTTETAIKPAAATRGQAIITFVDMRTANVEVLIK